MPRPPMITEHPSDLTVVSGTTASFTCVASGQPSPTFSWHHDGVEVTLSEEVTVSSSGGRSTLSVEGVGEEDEGAYHCQAENDLGYVSSETAELQLACESMCSAHTHTHTRWRTKMHSLSCAFSAVLDSQFQQSPVDTLATAGSNTRLDCLPPSSNPPPTISWTRNFALLPSSPRFSVFSNGSLLISSVELGDQAEYHCVATNLLLGVSATSDAAQLTVLCKPLLTYRPL